MLAADLEPSAEELRAREAELRIHGLIQLENCRRSALFYLENFVWTMDEHETRSPAKPLLHGDNVIDPDTLQMTRELDGREDDYLRYAALCWEREKLLLVPKSRQLRLSHLMVNLHGWLCQFHPGQRVAVQSKVFEDADALLERRWTSMKLERKLFPHIPWPHATRKVGFITWDNGSVMMAIKQGADKVRSYTFSAIMSDEMAFQDEAEESYTAAVPTIEGGDAKYTGISTAHPSFFEKLVFDRSE